MNGSRLLSVFLICCSSLHVATCIDNVPHSNTTFAFEQFSDLSPWLSADAADGSSSSGPTTSSTTSTTNAPTSSSTTSPILTTESPVQTTPRLPSPVSTTPWQQPRRHNLLIITADQLRHDTLGYRQADLAAYRNKLHVRTPNIDRLASQSVIFTDAYSQKSSCAPARATLRSGCTVERHGVQGNTQVRNYRKDERTNRKIDVIRTYDQILYHVGYQVNSFGKYHVPRRWTLDFDGRKRAIQYDSYETDFKYPYFSGKPLTDSRYEKQVKGWKRGKRKSYRRGQQTNPRTGWPYTPISLDPRFRHAAIERLGARTVKGGGGNGEGPEDNFGIDSLSANHSMSYYTGMQGVLALQRLRKSDKPWALTVSFENPHPPYIVAPEYAGYYMANRRRLLVPRSIRNRLTNTNYATNQEKMRRAGYNNPSKVASWTALYYGMVEQVDVWVGNILDELEQQGMADNTLVVFTSDHGEFLGAHGMQGKAGLLEEALRVPLTIKLPGKIKAGTIVSRPVSHLDLFATIMDYLGYSNWDYSDGKSLRPAIAGKSHRKYYDDEYAVSESGGDGESAAFMIRHGNWKLMIATMASSDEPDMLFNIDNDPYEMKNLIDKAAGNAINPVLTGKAEHLKCLLLEWLRRHDGALGYYSQPRWNDGQGRGDIAEIRNRRTWNSVDQWISDPTLRFKAPVFADGKWRSNAWLYIGRTNPGVLRIKHIKVVGQGQQFFFVNAKRGRIRQNGYLRIQIAFESTTRIDMKKLDVHLVIKSTVDKRLVVPIVT